MASEVTQGNQSCGQCQVGKTKREKSQDPLAGMERRLAQLELAMGEEQAGSGTSIIALQASRLVSKT
ncbi:hypothetical protein AMTR_s00008p00253710 [Amborella trichopoda]|uniref:Uncharacterized protein n=1 Tax=Amborella trichopoda TaxID=13333 RepID=W1NJN1_AMBTC|nr:hypothetical protein AMTR_s00008p00253710 [Amborella trichopoda]